MKSLRALRMHSNAERNAKTLQKCRRFVNNAFNGIGDDCARAQLDHWPVQFPCLVVASFCSSAHTHTKRCIKCYSGNTCHYFYGTHDKASSRPTCAPPPGSKAYLCVLRRPIGS